MQGADVLLAIAEVAVAFAGFASVAVLFQHRDPRSWSPAVVVRLRTMIEVSLVALFSALLPFVLHHLGLDGERLWATASACLAAALGAGGALVLRRSTGPLAGGQLSRSFSAAAIGATLLVLAALLLNSAGIGFQRAFGPYLLGVAWTLAFASLMFLRVVVFPTQPSGNGPQP